MPDSTLLRLHLQQQGGDRPLLCLHSSSASAGQWRALAACLQGRHRLLLPDLAGHGRSPTWPAGRAHDLATEAAGLWACLPPLPDGMLDIVGHSYGGALALQMALQRPQALRSLTLYEPVLFGLLRRHEPRGEAWREVARLARDVGTRVAAGEAAAAGALFCDYWSGTAAWPRLDPDRQAAIAARMAMVDRHFQALFAVDWDKPELDRLADLPLHLVCGGRTRVPTQRLSELLARTLPQAHLSRLPAAGHLGPISHAADFIGLVERALEELPAQACA